MLPNEWRSTMRPLQDRCEPTPYEDVEKLFKSDIGASIEDLFEDFDPKPVGVASLAQVHIGKHKESGRQVAVKVRMISTVLAIKCSFVAWQLQHPHLAEFCDIDMEMVEVTLGEWQ